MPTSLLALGPLLEGVPLGFDGARLDVMLALGFVNCRLRLGDRFIATVALLRFLGKLPPALGLALPLLSLEIDRSLPGRLFADLRGRGLFGLRPARAGMFHLIAGGQVGMLREASIRPGGAPNRACGRNSLL